MKLQELRELTERLISLYEERARIIDMFKGLERAKLEQASEPDWIQDSYKPEVMLTIKNAMVHYETSICISIEVATPYFDSRLVEVEAEIGELESK